MIFIGILIISEAQFSPGIVVKTICIDGLEFVISYPIRWKMGHPVPGEATPSIVQVYEKSDYAHGSPKPKNCK